MSERGLVVHQEVLSDIEEAMKVATDEITKQIADLLERVRTQTPGWDPTSDSHAAHERYQTRLNDGVAELTAALAKVRAEVAAHRETARETELENVAIVG